MNSGSWTAVHDTGAQRHQHEQHQQVEITAAMLDRLLHRSVVLNLDGDSYRLRDHHARTHTLRQALATPGQPDRTADTSPNRPLTASLKATPGGEFR
jgi:hypothetical protein